MQEDDNGVDFFQGFIQANDSVRDILPAMQQSYADYVFRKNTLNAIVKRLDCGQPGSQARNKDIVKLNIGGASYTINRTILLANVDASKRGNLLAAFLSGRWDHLIQDRGRIYLDFEPGWITPIFDYMRAVARNNGILSNPPVALRMRDQPGFDSVMKKFQLHGIFPSKIMSMSELSTIPCLNDPLCQEAIVGFLNEETCHPIGTEGSYSLQLIYRGSRHGFEAQRFHALCDFKGSTISVIRDTKGNVFGGFADISWDSPHPYIWKNSTKSFLFNLEKKTVGSPVQQEIVKFPLQNRTSSPHALCHYNTYLCAFGSGHDLYIADDCNNNFDSYTFLGSTYSNQSTERSGDQPMTSSVQRFFQVREIEVYRVLENHPHVDHRASPALSNSSNSSFSSISILNFDTSTNSSLSRYNALLENQAQALAEAERRLDEMRSEVEEQESSFLKEVLFVERMVSTESHSSEHSSPWLQRGRLMMKRSNGHNKGSGRDGSSGDDGSDNSTSSLCQIEAALHRIAALGPKPTSMSSLLASPSSFISLFSNSADVTATPSPSAPASVLTSTSTYASFTFVSDSPSFSPSSSPILNYSPFPSPSASTQARGFPAVYTSLSLSPCHPASVYASDPGSVLAPTVSTSVPASAPSFPPHVVSSSLSTPADVASPSPSSFSVPAAPLASILTSTTVSPVAYPRYPVSVLSLVPLSLASGSASAPTPPPSPSPACDIDTEMIMNTPLQVSNIQTPVINDLHRGRIVYFNVSGHRVCISKHALIRAAPESQLAKRVSGMWTEQEADLDEEGCILVDEPIECFCGIIAYLRLRALQMEEQEEKEMERNAGPAHNDKSSNNSLSSSSCFLSNDYDQEEQIYIYVSISQLPELKRMLDYYNIENAPIKLLSPIDWIEAL